MQFQRGVGTSLGTIFTPSSPGSLRDCAPSAGWAPGWSRRPCGHLAGLASLNLGGNGLGGIRALAAGGVAGPRARRPLRPPVLSPPRPRRPRLRVLQPRRQEDERRFDEGRSIHIQRVAPAGTAPAHGNGIAARPPLVDLVGPLPAPTAFAMHAGACSRALRSERPCQPSLLSELDRCASRTLFAGADCANRRWASLYRPLGSRTVG